MRIYMAYPTLPARLEVGGDGAWYAAWDASILEGRRHWVTAGLQNIYYTNILCQLTLVGAAVVYCRNRSTQALAVSLCGRGGGGDAPSP